jgi:hypothetical protein
MWKEEGGKGLIFLWECFFHGGVAREGKGVIRGEESVESSH